MYQVFVVLMGVGQCAVADWWGQPQRRALEFASRRARSCETAAIASSRVRLLLAFFGYFRFRGLLPRSGRGSGFSLYAPKPASGSWKMLSCSTSACLLFFVDRTSSRTFKSCGGQGYEVSRQVKGAAWQLGLCLRALCRTQGSRWHVFRPAGAWFPLVRGNEMARDHRPAATNHLVVQGHRYLH